MHHIDLPSLDEFRTLNAVRADACVSIFMPTTPFTHDAEAERTEMGNLAKAAVNQLKDAGFDKRRLGRLAESLDDLLEDETFWRFQAHSLAVLATPDSIRTYRLPNRLQTLVQVSDRFHLKPLLRAITFPHHAYVLALSEKAVRLVEVLPDLPAQAVRIPDLPKDAASAVGVSSLNNRTSMRRVMGSEGQKVRLAQYARIVDAALRPLLAGRSSPLILAATQPVDGVYRSVSIYPSLLPETITSTDDRSSDAEIAAAARPILDAAYARDVDAVKAVYEKRSGDNRVTTDISDAARAATFGAIETLLVDMDEIVRGFVDEETGAVTFDDSPSAYGVVDEIMGRALTSGARVLAVRRSDIPGGASLAATLRYPI